MKKMREQTVKHRPGRSGLFVLTLVYLSSFIPALACANEKTGVSSNGSPTPIYQVETLASGLDHPWSIAFLPNRSFLVSLRSGNLHRISSNGDVEPALENTPTSYVRSQGGYFDILLDPEFRQNQRIYLSYAGGTSKANATEVISATLGDNRLENTRSVFKVTPGKDTPLHYGGRMALLADGTILMTSGDGFQYREAAQDPFSQLGKVVRFNRDGSVPGDNPFADGKRADPYVYTMGHRNAQGLYVDSKTDTVYLHEHGAKGGDEVNILQAGKNYGWPAATHGVNYTGAIISPHKSLPGMEDPIKVWVPSIAPSGLTLYQGERFPAWNNSLLVGALVDREIRRLQLDTDNPSVITKEESLFPEIGERMRDVRVGPDGNIYLLTDSSNGRILRISPAN